MKRTKPVKSSLREIEDTTIYICERCNMRSFKQCYTIVYSIDKDIVQAVLCSSCVKKYLDKENEFKAAFMGVHNERS